MKFVLVSFIFLLSTSVWSQKGFQVIRRAEKKIEQEKYKQALRLLNRASKLDYGFCGNSWIEADEAIAINRAKVFDLTGQPIMAAQALNDSSLLFSREIDSLKTAYLISEFGKELVKQEIDSCIQAVSMDDLNNFGYWKLLNFNLKCTDDTFLLSHITVDSAFREMHQKTEDYKDKGILERFRIALRKQPFYTLFE